MEHCNATATLYIIKTLLTDTVITTGMRNAQIKPPSRLSQQLQKEKCKEQSMKWNAKTGIS